MSLAKFRQWTCAIFAGLVFSPISLSQENYDPNRFEKTELVSRLVQPMALAVAPNDDLYLIEIGGTIKRIDPRTGATEIVGNITVTTEQENGLIGIALDPNFTENGWIYLQYSPPNFSGQHISRFSLVDGKIDMNSEKLLLKYEEQRQECCHHAGEMTFGPDGCLYIGTGDNTNPFGESEGYAPLDNRDGKSAFSALRTASNTKSYNGKVLRIRPTADGGYEIPDGNLFPKDGSVGLPEIYVMGCRNPWRISVDSKTGDLYWGDVGPDAGGDGPRGPRGYDEVNQAKSAGYFGWPLFIADNKAYVSYDYTTKSLGQPFDPKAPINDSVVNTGAKQLPPAQPAWIYYPAGDSAEFPVLKSGGRTACAGPAYYFDQVQDSETKFPKHFDNALFIFEWSRNWIMAVHRNDDGSIRSIEPFLPNQKFTRPIDIEFDSKGAMYVIEYGETWGVNPDAKLVRLDYVRGNRAPTVKVQADKLAGKEPLEVHIKSEGTLDRDGDALEYAWIARNVLSNSEPVEIGRSSDVRWTATEPGVYDIALVVKDANGAQSEAHLTVTVGNAMPEIAFVQPMDGDFYSPGKPLTYRLSVRDVEDGTTLDDDTELDFIDPDAPLRTAVQAELVAGGDQENEAQVHPGLKLIRSGDCFNCHTMQVKLVGPSFLEIANKYRETPSELAKSIERVVKGSTGVWGKVAMLPHAQYSEEQAREMVEWIYAVEPNPSSEYRTGVSNEIALLQAAPEFTGSLQLTASYVDLGNDAIPSLTATKSIELRSRRIQAEQVSQIHDMQVLGSHNAENGKFCGSINHNSFLRIDKVPLSQFTHVTARVTSAGSGGDIEVRLGAVDGPLLATLPVKVNGSWDGWYEVQADCDLEVIRERLSEQPSSSVFFVCKNEKNRGALMNIDWVRFDP